MDKREKAKQLLVHYFLIAFQKAGLDWDWDNTAEINQAVDCIVDAAMDEIKQQVEAGTK